MFSDGKDIVDFIDNLLSNLKAQSNDFSQRPLFPVCLILLDINMPSVHGMEAMNSIKESFKNANEELVRMSKVQINESPDP